MDNYVVKNYKKLSYCERINLAREKVGKSFFSYTDIAQHTNKSVYKVKKELSDLSLLSDEVLKFLIKRYHISKSYILGNSEKMFAYYLDKNLDEVTDRFYSSDELDIECEMHFYGGGSELAYSVSTKNIQLNPITNEVKGLIVAEFTSKDDD